MRISISKWWVASVNLVQYLIVEGYLTEANPDFKEANVGDLVQYTISPVIAAVGKMGRQMRQRRNKEIISVDGVMGGAEEFVVIDEIAVQRVSSCRLSKQREHQLDRR